MAQIKLALIFITASIAACSSSLTTSSEEWSSPLYGEHPLVGSIWSSAENRFIDESQLLETIADARYLLLGEKHDNADHHRLQLQVVNSLLQQQRVSALAFEMLGSDAQARLDAVYQQRITSLDELKSYLQWDEAGWNWAFYGPLLQAGYDAGVRLLAANLSDVAMREVYGGELSPAVSEVLDAVVMDKLNLDIDESHCGMLPASQFPAMVRVQQSRDYQMAQTLLDGNAGGETNADNAGMAILIAGNYHVRKDLGVPNYLNVPGRNLAPGDVIVISFSEVDPDTAVPADYLQQFTDTPAYDYIWFTPAFSDEDYCASLRQEQ